MSKLSKNNVTIDHLKLAARHVEEMLTAGITENFAIRTLELFSDVYAKLHSGGSATPHHVEQVAQWSKEAARVKQANAEGKPRDYFRVEHGTPKRAFAKMVLELFRENRLTEESMNQLVARCWKLAVITIEEDERLNRVARSRSFQTPDERWAAAGIKFV